MIVKMFLTDFVNTDGINEFAFASINIVKHHHDEAGIAGAFDRGAGNWNFPVQRISPSSQIFLLPRISKFNREFSPQTFLLSRIFMIQQNHQNPQRISPKIFPLLPLRFLVFTFWSSSPSSAYFAQDNDGDRESNGDRNIRSVINRRKREESPYKRCYSVNSNTQRRKQKRNTNLYVNKTRDRTIQSYPFRHQQTERSEDVNKKTNKQSNIFRKMTKTLLYDRSRLINKQQ